tara:strand:- start:1402 stop:1746 length:345 start_codon:yes stop_codon:yes gene_type:complete
MSYRQRRAIQLWLGGGRKSKADALRRAGYSKAMYRQPHKFFNSPAVQAELDVLGYGYDGMGERSALPKAVQVSAQSQKTEEQDKITKVINNLSEEDIIKLRDTLDYDNIQKVEA